MLKVMTIVGTRPEIIKLSRVMAELDKYTEHIIVHTGQNYDYELNEIFFQELRIRKPDYFLDAAGKNAAETIANVIRKSDELMEDVRPDAVLLYGDTNSCISVISAKRKKIPIFHMEAGNRNEHTQSLFRYFFKKWLVAMVVAWVTLKVVIFLFSFVFLLYLFL